MSLRLLFVWPPLKSNHKLTSLSSPSPSPPPPAALSASLFASRSCCAFVVGTAIEGPGPTFPGEDDLARGLVDDLFGLDRRGLEDDFLGLVVVDFALETGADGALGLVPVEAAPPLATMLCSSFAFLWTSSL